MHFDARYHQRCPHRLRSLPRAPIESLWQLGPVFVVRQYARGSVVTTDIGSAQHVSVALLGRSLPEK